MADHRAEQILAAVLGKLTSAAVPTAVSIGRDHAYTYDASELPAVNICMGTEKPKSLLLSNQVEWALDVEIELACKESSTLSTTINALRKEVHAALRADYTLGLSFVTDTLPGDFSKPEQKDGDLPVMAAVATWTVSYRSSLDDPSA